MDNRPVRYTKLDSYDYDFEIEDDIIKGIMVYVGSNHGIDIADIASDINSNDGNIYVEGHYFRFESMSVETIELDNVRLTIHVTEI